MEDDLALYTPPSSCSRPLLISYNHSGNLSLDSWDPQVSDMVSVPPHPKKKNNHMSEYNCPVSSLNFTVLITNCFI